MRWLRVHPWRLEIVPAIAFAMTVWVDVYYVRFHHVFEREFTVRGAPDDWMTPIFVTMTAVLVIHWMSAMQMNHWWVIGEPAKRFNVFVPMHDASIIICASVVFSVYCILYGAAVRGKSETHATALEPLVVVLLLGVGVTCWLEATRRHVDIPDEPEPPVPSNVLLRTGNSFRYRETLLQRENVPSGLIFCGIGAYSHACGGPLTYGLALLGLGVLFPALFARTVVVTDREVRFCSLLFRRRIAVDDIASCRLVRGFIGDWRRVKKPKKSLFANGPCLEIQTIDGWTYRFGMKRPKLACGLLRPLLPAVEEPELTPQTPTY